MFLSAVIPAYLERENLKELTPRLIKTLDGLGLEYEILYAIEGDDGSREFLDNLSHPRIRYLYNPKRLGITKSLLVGFANVLPRADLILTMDADLNHQPEEIPNLMKCLHEKNADSTIGSRYIRGGRVLGMPAWKLLLSRAMNIFINVFSGIKTADKTSGFRIYKKDALKHIAGNIRAKNFEFFPESILVAHKAGFTFAETPINFIFRVHGESKMGKAQTILGYLKMFWRKLI
ncbi:MAG: glycosyltransferase [Patescibacteria group bacterium]